MRLWVLTCAVLFACGDATDATDDSASPAEQIPVDEDGDGVAVGPDCDDGDISVHPGADELCNGVDDDCDGDVDEDAVDVVAVYDDADGDGYGAADAGTACGPGGGQAATSGDCDDGDAGAHPGAPEICNGGVDDDCNGAADDSDDATGGTSWYSDVDGDGYGGGAAVVACVAPAGLIDDGSDCDDGNPSVSPDAAEICNGVDDDCDPFSTETGMIAVEGVTYWSIQNAIDAASEGGTVNVCDGTWFENLVVERSVTLEGQGADVSIIDGNADGSVVEVAGFNVDLVVRGLTLRNGSGSVVTELEMTGGGAIQAWRADTLLVESSIVTTSTAAYGGGIIGARTGENILADTVISGNSSTHGGGGAYLNSVYTAVNEIRDCEVSGNTTLRHGGGVQIDALDHDGSALITDTIFDANVASFGGGGLHSFSHVDMAGVTISNNLAGFGGGAWTGSGVDADDKTEVHGNATYDGGYGGGVVADYSGWDYGHIWGNTAAVGGGIVVYGGGELDNAIVESNHATDAGGGVWLDSGRVTASEVSSNTSDDVGGGLYVTGYGYLDSTIVSGNVAATEGGGAMVESVLYCAGSDWGTGATDNAPDDLAFLYWDEAEPVTYTDLGGDFVCDLLAGTCE